MLRYRLFLLLLIFPTAVYAQSTNWAEAETVTITLSSFEFTPETIQIEQGQAYRFVFVNSSSGGHNFVARDFFRVAEIAVEDRFKLDDGRIEIDAGESVEVRVMITQPGSYDVHCSHFMHSVFGMTGDIIVR